MELNGNRVYFDEEEQRKFDVQPVVTVESALETADSFRRIARILAKEYEDVEGDSQYVAVDPRVRLGAARHYQRALILDRFSLGIYDLCDVVNPETGFDFPNEAGSNE